MIRLLFASIFVFVGFCQAQLNWNQVTSMSFNRPVTTLFSDTLENKLYIGGYFRFYDSLDYKGVASWDGASITNLSCGLGGCTSVSCGGVIQF